MTLCVCTESQLGLGTCVWQHVVVPGRHHWQKVHICLLSATHFPKVANLLKTFKNPPGCCCCCSSSALPLFLRCTTNAHFGRTVEAVEVVLQGAPKSCHVNHMLLVYFKKYQMQKQTNGEVSCWLLIFQLCCMLQGARLNDALDDMLTVLQYYPPVLVTDFGWSFLLRNV